MFRAGVLRQLSRSVHALRLQQTTVRLSKHEHFRRIQQTYLQAQTRLLSRTAAAFSGNDDKRDEDDDTSKPTDNKEEEATDISDESHEDLEARMSKENRVDETEQHDDDDGPRVHHFNQNKGDLGEPEEIQLDATAAHLVGPVQPPAFWPEAVVLPLARHPVFPKFVRMIEITDKAMVDRIQQLRRARHPFVGAFLLKPDTYDEANPPSQIDALSEVEPIGTFCQIHEMSTTREGYLRVMLEGLRRIHITGQVQASEPIEDQSDTPMPLVAKIDNLTDEPFDRSSQEIKALSHEVIASVRDVVSLNPMYRENMNRVSELGSRNLDNPVHLCDFAAALTSGEPEELQAILEELNIKERLHKTLELLKKELLQLQLQKRLGKEVEDKLNKMQREVMLREQLKLIKKELGMTKDDSDSLRDKFMEALEGKVVPEDAQAVIDEELAKLSTLESHSGEFGITRTYLDWLTCLPWGVQSKDKLDIAAAKGVLDADHYGMADVKDRILEFIAVSKLRGTMQGKILTFVGPPGVGKTSIAKSIARALDRKFYRFSCGGLTDVAEIKGHRRTYMGAMPGKPLQCFKQTEVENPVILLDEVDKIGASYRGDPTSALLELLDPEQNSTFLDHYLDVPVDMSKVLFICTANVKDTIPGPLYDRMEVIDLAGYTAEEKRSIARTYLVPQAQRSTGVTAGQLELTDDVIDALSRGYCRESGVRNLGKHIEKIYRKAALKLVDSDDKHLTVTTDNLKDYVGQPIFTEDRMFTSTPPGVVMGLAWTAMGGSTLYIETVASSADRRRASLAKDDADNKGKLAITGSLGDVMKESSQIAYVYAKHFLEMHDEKNRFFDVSAVSLHVPEGATPKDGPSAGCTMVTALLSLAMDKPVRQDFAMTGEVSLTGQVLRVGGIKEKVLAAKRSGVKTVVLPKGNKMDWDDLDDSVRAGLEVHFASRYQDVYDVAFEA
eukprot:TRINITY_DN9909_c0_g1_i2.p1 TRINITY_DN9909_c0_g1~~TRINITY_DN9909_c0_g1_i2.p1  ORF type:complete len:953 (+),score=260.68 TRINITY_DN9909_c0_g1_i2:119-2977(+)